MRRRIQILFVSLIFLSVTLNAFGNAIVYTGYGSNAYGPRKVNNYIKLLQKSSTDTGDLLYTCHVTNQLSTDLVCGDYDSPTLTRLENAIGKLKANNFQVALRFYVDVKTGDWRALYDPSDKDVFFNKFKNELVSFAKFAQTQQVQTLIIGAELEKLTLPIYTVKWVDIIKELRAVFSGKISYAANGNYSYYQKREYEWIDFWDHLDFIMVNHYPGTNQTLITVSQFTEHHKMVLAEIENNLSPHGLPIYIGEVGFPLAKNGYQKPWQWVWEDSTRDRRSQKRSLKGFLRALKETSISGFHLWRFLPSELNEYPAGYHINNKGFLQILADEQ